MVASKLYFVIVLIGILILTTSVTVNSQNAPDEPVCKEPRPYACPEVICSLINSRETDFCKDIHCEGLTAENCTSKGSVLKRGLTMCGCCPGCAKYLDEGEPCEVASPGPSPYIDCPPEDEICPLLMNRCKSGLVCNILGAKPKTCTVDPNSAPTTDSCEEKRDLGLQGRLHWTPNCEEDGTYSPKQCKGNTGNNDDGVCFCVDPNGNRIFGREWWSKSANQTCDCSRQVFNLRSQGNIATIHCSSDGNYEALQCDTDSGLCYCVNPETGKLTGAVLPENRWKELPCFSLNVTGGDPTGTYLRVCESEWGAGQQLYKEAITKGLKVLSSKDLDCGYDGAYRSMLRIGGLIYCANELGDERSGYYEVIGQSYMDCQCYRDSLIYIKESRHFSKDCQNPTGNYAAISVITHNEGNEGYSCVDKDGIFFGDEARTQAQCCLLGDCSQQPPDIGRMCYDESTNPNGIRPCSYWPQ